MAKPYVVLADWSAARWLVVRQRGNEVNTWPFEDEESARIIAEIVNRSDGPGYRIFVAEIRMRRGAVHSMAAVD